jgi:hypothetical protein
MNIFSKYQNTLSKENNKKIYYQRKNMKKNLSTRNHSRSIKQINILRNQFSIGNKNNTKEDNSERIRYSPNLFDENYEYDEDDDEKTQKRENSLKKNKTSSKITFFKLNKDRANIYKKMNDLRKLQMAYFGGRFLNTKINSGMSTSYGGNIFDEFVHNYIKNQNHINSSEEKYNKKKINFGKKIVAKISANQKFNYKTTITLKKPSKYRYLNEKYQFKNLSDVNKMNFSLFNKKTTMSSTNNERTINKYLFEENNKTHSKSTSNGKCINVKKVFNIAKTGQRNEISNYYCKKK